MKYHLFGDLATKLYNRGWYGHSNYSLYFLSHPFRRFHAGAQAVSTLGLPVIPDSAFEDALREYEEDLKTDTDGENRDSD
jgi:hypothetical protein